MRISLPHSSLEIVLGLSAHRTLVAEVACVGAGDKPITTEVVVVLFFTHGLRLI
jgi:hypothetical protein